MILVKDKRAIIIRSPKLQKIRNNLRDVFFQAARLRRKVFYDKRRSLLFRSDGSRRSIHDFSPDELAYFRKLQRQESIITDMINRSILSCVTCGKGERDMVYNKTYGAWYCTECYGMERLSALKRANVKKDMPRSCEEEGIESHSKTFL